MCRKMTISLTPTPNFPQFLFELLTLNGTKCIEAELDMHESKHFLPGQFVRSDTRRKKER
jgi:hypothetical protein